MSFNQNFPFNFKPTSVTATSGNYTVAANEYVFVTASCRQGQSLIVDGNTVLDTAPISSWVNIPGSGTYDVPAGRFVTYINEDTGAGLDQIEIQPSGGGPILSTAARFANQVNSVGLIETGIFNPGLQARIVSLNNTADVWIHVYSPNASNTNTGSFWFPPGTQLTGNANKTISRFLIP